MALSEGLRGGLVGGSVCESQSIYFQYLSQRAFSIRYKYVVAHGGWFSKPVISICLFVELWPNGPHVEGAPLEVTGFCPDVTLGCDHRM